MEKGIHNNMSGICVIKYDEHLTFKELIKNGKNIRR